MICPMCNSQIALRRKSIMDPSRNVYFCLDCPMVYQLLRNHEEETISRARDLVLTYGGGAAFS